MSTDISENELIAEIAELRALLRTKEADLANLRRKKQITQEYGLNNNEIDRYSRQLFLPEVGVQGGYTIRLFRTQKYTNVIQFSCQSTI